MPRPVWSGVRSMASIDLRAQRGVVDDYFSKPRHGLDHAISRVDDSGREVTSLWTTAEIAFRFALGRSKDEGSTVLVRRYGGGAWREVARYVKGADVKVGQTK